MLIEVQSVSGTEYINPDQITHISPLRDSVMISYSDQGMTVLMVDEWQRIKPLVVEAVRPSIGDRLDLLKQKYQDLLIESNELSERLKNLDRWVAESQSRQPGAAEDLKLSTSPILVDLVDVDQSDEPPGVFAEVEEVESDLKRLIKLVKRGNYLILDTETTGLDHRAEICSIAIIDDTGTTLLDTLVKPVRGIPSDATRIHGITNDMVKDARGWLNVNDQVWQLLEGRDVVVYNASYDFRLLEQSEQACEPFALSDWGMMTPVCAMSAYAEHVGDWNDYHGNYRWHKLTDAARAAGFRLPEGMKPHSAVADCHMTLAVGRFLAGLDGTI